MSFWCHRFDQNSNEYIVRISALKFFVASWGLPGSFLGLSGDLVCIIINKEAYRKPPGSYKKFQGRNPCNIFVAILVKTMTSKRHFEINRPLAYLEVDIYWNFYLVYLFTFIFIKTQLKQNKNWATHDWDCWDLKKPGVDLVREN